MKLERLFSRFDHVLTYFISRSDVRLQRLKVYEVVAVKSHKCWKIVVSSLKPSRCADGQLQQFTHFLLIIKKSMRARKEAIFSIIEKNHVGSIMSFFSAICY